MYHRSSRSTVREIPIQRSASAFAPTSSTLLYTSDGGASNGSQAFPMPSGLAPYNSSTTVYTTSKYPSAGGSVTAGSNQPAQEEYYRREVNF